MSSALEEFHWEPQPAAQRLVNRIVEDFIGRTPAAADLARRMKAETGTRFFDWIDHLVLPDRSDLLQELATAGFVPQPASGGEHCFAQLQGMFPRIVLSDDGICSAAIKVESIADFAAANQLPLATIDPPLSPYRRLLIGQGKESSLWAVERHGWRGFTRPELSDRQKLFRLLHLEKFRTRQRTFKEDFLGFVHTMRLIEAAIADMGVDAACDLFFAAEREYWQRRNHAARVQKARQDRLGLAWANHDHHTYRSSRRNFIALIGVLEKLGFVCRERFYTGRQAGWGAQILEQPNAGVVVFADVDLSPDELMNDFAHEPLQPLKQLGTVGLWCALHGEAFFEAGMHHLECQFDFDALRNQLQQQAGVKLMNPFTNFPYLRQAFTEGERWPVQPARIKRLLELNQITPKQAQEFSERGALGSHLENLERNDGFKGFNQEGVSKIIEETDPRANAARGA